MMLGQLIKELEAIDPLTPVRFGFAEPDSYRGFYQDVAFTPTENTNIGDMLYFAKQALGSTYEGYKGGENTMNEYTDCWIAEYGRTAGATSIGDTLINYWKQGASTP